MLPSPCAPTRSPSSAAASAAIARLRFDADRSTRCPACAGGVRHPVFGMDPDGLVLCRGCGAPLFYCDLGGQG